MKISTAGRTVVATAIAVLMILQSHHLTPGVNGATGFVAGVDLKSESRILDAWVNDLVAYDKQCKRLGLKTSLTRAELEPVQRSSDDLKRRLSSLQSALREAIRKLKAAGQWDKLDATLAAKIRDAKFQSIARQQSFRQTLEDAATQLGGEAAEISAPLEPLRKKITARLQLPQVNSPASNPALVRVAYNPAPTMFAASLRCRISWLRFGLSQAFSDDLQASDKARYSVGCYCQNDSLDCDHLQTL
jgi:hypothetical protein